LNRDLLRLLLIFFLAWLLVLSGKARASEQKYSLVAPAIPAACHAAPYSVFTEELRRPGMRFARQLFIE